MASDDMGSAGWVLLGGGLLIVAGGAAFALSRRPRRRHEEVVGYDVPVAPIMPAARPVPATVASVVPAQAVAPPQEHFARVAPEEPRRARVASVDRVHSDASYDDRRALLEAMIAEAPSRANPFHSRRNRLRRADFLLRTGQAQPKDGLTAAERAGVEPAMASDRWSEMRFGGAQKARISWKPAPAR
ncbi:hypothetical protein LWE61_15240 [Sphingobium sufflavum]|nr:hypothetical protein [Sphingobium sufflavum]